jgi:glycosyltransferase involved in cell wall biosynthesis
VIDDTIDTTNHALYIPQTKKNQLAYIGRIAPIKQVEHVITCLHMLHQQWYIYTWVIVGKCKDTVYMQSLIDLVATYNLQDYIYFTGFVSDGERDKLLGESRFALVPSQKEWYGLVCLEANLRHTPVIAYRNPGLVDSIVDEVNGILVKPDDIHGIAESVIYHDKYPDIYTNLVASSYTHVISLPSWADNTQTLLSYIYTNHHD